MVRNATLLFFCWQAEMKPWVVSDQQNRDQLLKGGAAQEVTGKRDRSNNSSVGSSQHGVAAKRDNTCNSSRDNRNRSLLLVRHEDDTLQSKKGLDCTRLVPQFPPSSSLSSGSPCKPAGLTELGTNCSHGSCCSRAAV